MKEIATTTSDFADLRRQRCIYVDKTAYFHRLASSMGTRMYFLARPSSIPRNEGGSSMCNLFASRVYTG